MKRRMVNCMGRLRERSFLNLGAGFLNGRRFSGVMTLSLGPLRLRNPYLLAPMEGVSDIGFRKLCFSLGASLTFTEMVRGAAFVRGNSATLDLIDTYDAGTLTGAQFITKGPEELNKIIGEFFELRERKGFSHLKNIKAIDLNFGCPSEDIIRVGLGPAMLKRTARMEGIFRTLRAAVKAHDDSIAVGAKLRLGLNQGEKERRIVHRLVPAINANLDYVAVHAKHAGQRGSEPADWNVLRDLRDIITIPLIGNGGVFTADDAHRMMRETSVDGVMVSRGAAKNPWMFRALARNGPELPSAAEVEAAWKQYKEMAMPHRTKRKYLDFHEGNFRRMLDEAKARPEGGRK
jgi:tRNA-dihydrouridine synthase B